MCIYIYIYIVASGGAHLYDDCVLTQQHKPTLRHDSRMPTSFANGGAFKTRLIIDSDPKSYRKAKTRQDKT